MACFPILDDPDGYMWLLSAHLVEVGWDRTERVFGRPLGLKRRDDVNAGLAVCEMISMASRRYQVPARLAVVVCLPVWLFPRSLPAGERSSSLLVSSGGFRYSRSKREFGRSAQSSATFVFGISPPLFHPNIKAVAGRGRVDFVYSQSGPLPNRDPLFVLERLFVHVYSVHSRGSQ